MLAVTESLVTHHDVTVPSGLGSPGREGHIYSIWYPLLSFLAVPFVYGAFVLSRIGHLPFHYIAAVSALVLQCLLTAANAGVVVLLSRRLGASPRGSWLAALSFAFSSVALVYSRTFYAEPLLALLSGLSLYLILGRTKEGIATGAFLTTLAVLAKPSGIVVGPILSAYLIVRKERFPLSLLPFVGTVFGLALYAGYNYWRFGSPTAFGQPWAFDLSSVTIRILALLLSPGWGLLWYCPAVILVVFAFPIASRTCFLEALTTVTIFAGYLALHGFWTVWYGGWSWGPRFLLPALPGLYALLGFLQGRVKKTLLLLSALGFLINAPTLFSYYERYYAESLDAGNPIGPETAWSFGRAPFLHAWPAAIRETEDASHSNVKELFTSLGSPSHAIQDSRSLRIVALWWWVLPAAGLPRWLGLLLAAISFIIGCFLIGASTPAESG